MLRSCGVEGVDAVAELPFSEWKKVHERFAIETERYLAEGKAPGNGMRKFLRRLGSFIRDFYRMWRNTREDEIGRQRYLDQFGEEMPDLSPEVLRILDRMVPGEAAVVDAERTASLQPMFLERPEGMPDDLWEELQAASREAGNEALEAYAKAAARDERWYEKKRAAMAGNEAPGDDAAAKRAAVRKEVESRVRSLPCYTAIELISTDNLLTGTRCGVDAADVRSLGFPERDVKALKRLGVVVDEGGLKASAALEIIRPFARFNSARQMLAEILAAGDKARMERRIEEETTRECLARYSDALDPVERDKVMTQALAGEARGRMVATELK